MESVDDTQPEIKKRKLSSSSENMSSKCFTNNDNHKQFQSIYSTLTNLSHLSHLSSLTITTISEYATGCVYKCDNYEKCNTLVCLLEADKYESREENEFLYVEPQPRMFGEEDCNHAIQLFCGECAKLTRHCDYESRPKRFWCSRRYIPCASDENTTLSAS